jgi:tRNA nucleotidyltransferase (CCA-adding enzyme)
MINYTEFLFELVNSDRPSEYFEQIKHDNLISYLPELNSLINCIHDPVWHPEGDVWIHTLMVIDAAASLRHNFISDYDKCSFMLGALCHDLGKPYTTEYTDGRLRSLMHDQTGTIPTRILLNRLDIDEFMIDKVISYVQNHLIPIQLYKNQQNVSDKAILKLQSRIHIPDLVQLTRADHWGRTDYDAINRKCKSADWLLTRYNKIIH